MDDLVARRNAAQQELATLSSYASNYFSQMPSMTDNMRQKEKLEGQLSNLKAEHALIKQSADTYERDFLDRTETGRASTSGFFARRGISTLQDWTLFLFFATYAAWLLVLIVYTLRFSSRKLFTVGFILFFGPILGIFFGALILRLG